jgi:hypothetical protein
MLLSYPWVLRRATLGYLAPGGVSKIAHHSLSSAQLRQTSAARCSTAQRNRLKKSHEYALSLLIVLEASWVVPNKGSRTEIVSSAATTRYPNQMPADARDFGLYYSTRPKVSVVKRAKRSHRDSTTFLHQLPCLNEGLWSLLTRIVLSRRS